MKVGNVSYLMLGRGLGVDVTVHGLDAVGDAGAVCWASVLLYFRKSRRRMCSKDRLPLPKSMHTDGPASCARPRGQVSSSRSRASSACGPASSVHCSYGSKGWSAAAHHPRISAVSRLRAGPCFYGWRRRRRRKTSSAARQHTGPGCSGR